MSPNNYQTRLPLPWLTSPAPKSLIQPDISVTLKKTRVKAAVIPRSYPYIADASGNHPHFEWRGKGAPPRDVGYPGDVYLDLAAPHYALWARGKNGWTEWTTNSRKADLIPHPHISDRYLWCSARRPVWYSISAIKTDRCRRPFPSSVEAIREVLHNEETQSKNNMGKQGKRSRDRCESDGSEVSEVSESDEGSTVLVVSRKATRSRLDSEQGSIAGPSYTASSSLEESSQCVDEKDVIATKRYEDLTMSEVRSLAEAGRPANIAKAVSVALRTSDKKLRDLTVENEELRKKLAAANAAYAEATRRAEMADKKLHAIATLTSN